MAKYTEWCPALEAALSEPFPAAVVKQKSKGGTRIAFVPWHHYVRRLNALVGSGWSMGEPVVREVAGKLVLGVPVTILGVSRVNFGDEDEGKDDYGTASTNAWAQAFKRTCALFGIGLDMYDKDGSGEAVVQQAQQEPAREASVEDKARIMALMGERQVDAQNYAKLSKVLKKPMSAAVAETWTKWLEAQPELESAKVG